MAEQCANCGRSDLLQPDVANIQCLACGALTSIATGQVVTSQTKNPELSNAGFPVVELSTGVEVAPASEYHPPTQPADSPENVPETPVAPAPVETAPIPDPVDLAGLSFDQVAAIEHIIHPEV